jgi:hypothetical protein
MMPWAAACGGADPGREDTDPSVTASIGSTAGTSVGDGSSTSVASGEATTLAPSSSTGVDDADTTDGTKFDLMPGIDAAGPVTYPVRMIPNLVSITFYERSGGDAPTPYTFPVDGPELTTRLADPLSEANLDIMGVSTEFGNYVASFVALGDNAAPETVDDTIDGDLQTNTTMGNTIGTAERLRVTLGFESSSGPPG